MKSVFDRNVAPRLARAAQRTGVARRPRRGLDLAAF
jgi:hypothetical protein